MRDPKRIDGCIDALKKLWEKYPDMRIGQLMSNILTEYYSQTNYDPFFLEDDIFIKFIENLWEPKDEE